ncbi:MAG TPA: hypothetical protein VJC00_04520 [Candidatus Nanoarchaeia archaeon]|nr:hypothetical protein [Candidatus Nanoarchaeia archaeon]
MAKKEKASVKKDNTLLWGIGVLILIVVVIILVRGRAKEAPVSEPTPAAPTEPVATPKEPVQVLNLEEANCDESATIGYKACSLIEGGDVDFTILHQGAGALKGFQYYLYDMNGEKIGEDSQMMAVEGGAEATLTLPVSKFTGVERVEIRPVMNLAGVDSICKNQRVIQHVSRC